jgi:aryl-alcohol dehydrogenase-like predicted oxidoreductase
MHYVNLGATGLRVSRVCLGMMSFGNVSDKPWVIDEEAAAAEQLKLSDEEIARLEEPYVPHPVLGHA